jgi:hypothetical protein
VTSPCLIASPSGGRAARWPRGKVPAAKGLATSREREGARREPQAGVARNGGTRRRRYLVRGSWSGWGTCQRCRLTDAMAEHPLCRHGMRRKVLDRRGSQKTRRGHLPPPTVPSPLLAVRLGDWGTPDAAASRARSRTRSSEIRLPTSLIYVRRSERALSARRGVLTVQLHTTPVREAVAL